MEREGKEECSRAVAGFTLGGEHTILRPASRCFWEIMRLTRGTHDSTARIPVGISEKQLVVRHWTLCQKVFRRDIAPPLCVKRSAP